MTAAERAYAYMKERIIRGELVGGARLSEGQICAELELSRTPVHEAFLRLEAERLLTLSSRQGAVVTAIPPGEARDVLEMRGALERTAAARVVADRVDPARITAALRTPLGYQREALDCDDLNAYVVADCDFHGAVISLSGNRIAAHYYDLLRDRQLRLFHQVLTVGGLKADEAFDEHEDLARLLAAHDGAGYLAVLDRHLARHQGVL
ncbi:GntR family transcriptional regulator [Catenuloplanes atrovinosus]|uniref:DNA-binding GntR family transcriptional regulator n=1 Tax=Catenuloplanes atrovinosus TaxID=137266 RepID=A0AAE4C9V4_9ACTN|nr:GntR family transcriptional regulator [Catenuloplanes atrovinosus]MDR7275189.1 DNA-binding GntR family transcriptional regulator [Catenuloplanes atrovinosus]